MPRVVISGPAEAFADDPRSRDPIKDQKTLGAFRGLTSEQACADSFTDPLSKLGISGGRLWFRLADDGRGLRITTTYRVPRRLTDTELHLLVDATRAQWSDGIGSGSFKNHQGTVLSTALAMALLNADPSRKDLGKLFVDAFPLFADEKETQVELLDTDGPEKDAYEYVQEAALFGDGVAKFQMVVWTQSDPALSDERRRRLAFEHYRQVAEAGDLVALLVLGGCYQRGAGTPGDPRRAFACFEAAAKRGQPDAVRCLAACYLDGQGVAADPDEGIRWYSRGREAGDVVCALELAERYERGSGVPRDLREALSLYQRCLEDGWESVGPIMSRIKEELAQSEVN
jgi:hypothetical protein